jgi:hypothetical protein
MEYDRDMKRRRSRQRRPSEAGPGETLPLPTRLGVPLAVGIAGLTGVWFLGRDANPGPPGFRLDDAWIHLVYGRGLLAEGFLASLWAVVLAAIHALLGGRPSPDAVVPAVLVVGALLHLGGTGVAADLGRRLTGSDRAGLAAGCLVALATPLAAAALSGMEVAVAGLLLLLGVRDLAGGSTARAGAWLALAGLARPESAAVTVVLVLFRLAGGRPRRSRAEFLPDLARVLGPSIVVGTALVAYDLWASGAPLPATYYAKSSGVLADLPRRLGVGLTRYLPGVPPFGAGLGWLALLGFAVGSRSDGRGGAGTTLGRGGAPPVSPGVALLPLAGGAAFLLSNLFLIDPADPEAFYHLRYLLPSIPLLLVALAVGAHRGGNSRLVARLGPRARSFPVIGLLALSGIGAILRIGPESRSLHNDVRNINEVQRRIGEWCAASFAPGTWIAASDAGAIRYFSDLPTIDVIGLNTPEMREPDEAFVRAHPVAALALIPAWFRALDPDRLETEFEAHTERYTVTGNPRMARQVVLRAAGGDSPDASPVRVRFVGFHRFALDFLPWQAILPAPDRDAP